jgi:hypothetical protein
MLPSARCVTIEQSLSTDLLRICAAMVAPA